MKLRVFIAVLLTLLAVTIYYLYRLGGDLIAAAPQTVSYAPGDLPFESVTFSNKSTGTIHGWLLAGKADQAVVLLLHSIRSNRMEMLGRARFLYQAGYSVLLMDFQAHGESSGENVSFGYLEAYDVDAAIAYLRKRFPSQPLGAIGTSLGGVATVMSAGVNKLDAMVLEAIYSDLATAVGNRIALRIGPLGHQLSPLLLWQVNFRLGFDPGLLSPINRVASIKKPMFLIAGSEDKHTTIKESRDLFQRINAPKRIWEVKGAKHQNFHSYKPIEYERRVLQFFAKYLRPSAS